MKYHVINMNSTNGMAFFMFRGQSQISLGWGVRIVGGAKKTLRVVLKKKLWVEVGKTYAHAWVNYGISKIGQNNHKI